MILTVIEIVLWIRVIENKNQNYHKINRFHIWNSKIRIKIIWLLIEQTIHKRITKIIFRKNFKKKPLYKAIITYQLRNSIRTKHITVVIIFLKTTWTNTFLKHKTSYIKRWKNRICSMHYKSYSPVYQTIYVFWKMYIYKVFKF